MLASDGGTSSQEGEKKGILQYRGARGGIRDIKSPQKILSRNVVGDEGNFNPVRHFF